MIRAWFHVLMAVWHTRAAEDFTAAAATFRLEGEAELSLIALHEAGKRVLKADAHLEKMAASYDGR